MTKITPMLASVGPDIPRGEGWVFEPKYDGIRVLGFASSDGVGHVSDRGQIETRRSELPAALFAFDMLVDGKQALVAEPRRVRRKHLAALLRPPGRSNALRLSDVADDGDAMLREARRHAWEGVIAKRADAPYERALEIFLARSMHRRYYDADGKLRQSVFLGLRDDKPRGHG